MTKKILVAVGAIAILGLVGAYLALRTLVSDDHVRSQLAARLSDAAGQPVRIAQARLALTPKIGIELRGVEVGEPTRISADAVRLATGLRALLGRRIERAELIVDGGRVVLPLPPLAAGPPSVGPAAPVESAPAGGMRLVSIDTIALRNFQVTADDRTLAVDLETTFAGGRLEIRKLRVQADAAVVEGTGTVTGLESAVAALDLTADNLDLDALAPLLAALAAASDSGGASDPGAVRSSRPATRRTRPGAGPLPAMSVTLTASRGRVGGAAFTGLEARLKTAGRVLTVEALTFGVFGGHCSGSLSVDLGPSVPAFAGRATMEGIDMARVMAHAGKEGAMTGRLSGTIKVGGHGADAAGTIRGLEGSGRVDVKNGTLPHLDLVGSVVRALGRPGEAPAGSGEAFETLGGSFILAGGVARSSDLAFESRDVDLDGTGRLSLSDGTVNVRANLRLSEELTRRMGRDGARLTSENGRMTVPAVLSGPIEAPGVAVDVNAMARRAAAEEAKKQIGRRLNELLKKPGGGGAR